MIYDTRRKYFLAYYVIAVVSSCEFASVKNIREFILKIHVRAWREVIIPFFPQSEFKKIIISVFFWSKSFLVILNYRIGIIPKRIEKHVYDAGTKGL